jgi:uncharacterized membrane protein (UPF0127 family)
MRLLSPIPLLAILILTGCNAVTPVSKNDATSVTRSSAFPTVRLKIATPRNVQHLSVEVAVTEEQQEHGLMHRATLPQGRGMLFPFSLPRTASFWMKDTQIPLDLLFIRTDGTIAAILHGKPNDLRPLSAGEPVIAVMEIGSGEANRLGIGLDSHIEWGDCREGRQRPGVPINPLAFCPTAP